MTKGLYNKKGILSTSYSYIQFASIPSQIPETVNFISSESSSIFVTSNTFGEDLLKTVISLFVVVNPIGKVPLFVTLTKKMEKQNKSWFRKMLLLPLQYCLQFLQ